MGFGHGSVGPSEAAFPLTLCAAAGARVVFKPVDQEAEGVSHNSHNSFFDHAHVTRLDRPSSGLVLSAASLRSLVQLLWQMRAYVIDRCYAACMTGSCHRGGSGAKTEV